MSKCIVLIGPPCSGKSTIGKELASRIEYRYISSGDIARKMAEEDGTMSDLNAGKMAPEDKMRNEIIKVFNNEDIILDGFPRFVEQYDWLMSNIPFNYELMFIVIDVPTLDLFNRAISRNRTDDIAIVERLEYYMKNTVPMIHKVHDVYSVINLNAKCTTNTVWRKLYDCGWIR